MLVETLNAGTHTRYLPATDFPILFKEYQNQPGYLVLKNHQLTEPARQLLQKQQALSLGIHRDLRDVAVSIMNKWQISFDEMMAQGFLENAIEMSAAWALLPGHLEMRYDDLVQNPAQEIIKIAHHLQLDHHAADIETIIAEHSLEKQQKKVQQIQQEKIKNHIQGDYWDEDLLLHHNHITTGKSGAWRTVFSNAQIQQVEQRFGDWLRNHGYPLSHIPTRAFKNTRTKNLNSQKQTPLSAQQHGDLWRQCVKLLKKIYQKLNHFLKTIFSNK